MKPVKIRGIIQDLLGIPIETIEDCTKRHEDIMGNEWYSRNPKTPTEIRKFYSESYGMLWNMLAHSGLNIDGTQKVHPFDMVAKEYPKLVNNLDVIISGKCLDYGCGLGRYGLVFANYHWHVTLVDIKGHTFNLTKKWITMQERDNVRFLSIPIEQDYADLGKEQFNVIIVYDVLEHVPEPLELLDFLINHVVSGGLMLMDICFDNLSEGGMCKPRAPYHLQVNYERYNDPKVWYGLVEERLKPVWKDENKVPKVWKKC